MFPIFRGFHILTWKKSPQSAVLVISLSFGCSLPKISSFMKIGQKLWPPEPLKEARFYRARRFFDLFGSKTLENDLLWPNIKNKSCQAHHNSHLHQVWDKNIENSGC